MIIIPKNARKEMHRLKLNGLGRWSNVEPEDMFDNYK